MPRKLAKHVKYGTFQPLVYKVSMVVKIEMFNGRGVNSEHFMGLTLCEANSLCATMKCTRFLTGQISWGELTTRGNHYLGVFGHSVRWHFSSTL